MAGKKGQRKRFWSDDEKCSICRQARAPGVSVAQVARRYAMNSNLIFTWLRDPRFAPAEVNASGDLEDELSFCRSRSPAWPPNLVQDLPLRRTGRRAAPFLPIGSTSRCRTGDGSWWRVRRSSRRCWDWFKG